MDSARHAIVIGGSMGGLLAARVLSDHFDDVTIVEKDILPEAAENRRGVPQGRHTHALLASGREVLERFFPGLTNELVALGAVPCDAVEQGVWYHEGGLLARCPSGTKGVLASRPLLESVVRRRVLATPRVSVRQNTAVEDLEWSPAGDRVTGVRMAEGVVPASLVVDCTGRASHSIRWLEKKGFSAPREEKIEIALAYTTRWFRRRPEQLGGNLLCSVAPTPEGKRGGVLLAQEGDRWTVTLIGYHGHSAPTDLAGFVEFARSLPGSEIYDVVREAEPLGDAASARMPASVRRRYESLERFPGGFLVFGDSISSFNPSYGQGMSVAALEAVQLDKCVAEGPVGLAGRFFQRAARVVDIPWSIAAGGDLRMPETAGPRNGQVRFVNWYLSKLLRGAHRDRELSLAFHRVANLAAPPQSILRPNLALRVLWAGLRPEPAQAVKGDLAANRATS